MTKSREELRKRLKDNEPVTENTDAVGELINDLNRAANQVNAALEAKKKWF